MRKRPQETGDERRIGEGEQIQTERAREGSVVKAGGFIDAWSQDTDAGADNLYRGPSTDSTYKKIFFLHLFSRKSPPHTLLSVSLSLSVMVTL